MTWFKNQTMGFKALLAVNAVAIVGVFAYFSFDEAVSAEQMERTSAYVATVPGELTRVRTNRELDLLISGRGFFQVQLPDGRIAYTRVGTFRVSPDGDIVTSSLLPLVNGLSVPGDRLSLTVGTDGTVAVLVANQVSPTIVGQINLVRFMNDEGLKKMAQYPGLFLETGDSGSPEEGIAGEDGFGFIEQGYLERVGKDWMEYLVTELLSLVSESDLDVDVVAPTQRGGGVNQLQIVVNL